MLTGQGRPDIVAKIHIAQIPLYTVVAYFLIRKYSIGGAAVAFTLRVSFETLLILSSLRVGIWKFFLKSVSGRMICVVAGMLLLNALYKYVFSVNLHIFAYLAVYLLLYAVLFWRLLINGTGLPGRGGRDSIWKRLMFVPFEDIAGCRPYAKYPLWPCRGSASETTRK
jgi:O-antigen/teichoic acid export membrane protein